MRKYLGFQKPDTLEKAIQMAQDHMNAYEERDEEENQKYVLDKMTLQDADDKEMQKAHIPRGHKLNRPIKTKPNIYNNYQGGNSQGQTNPGWNNNSNNRGRGKNYRGNYRGRGQRYPQARAGRQAELPNPSTWKEISGANTNSQAVYKDESGERPRVRFTESESQQEIRT